MALNYQFKSTELNQKVRK